MVGGTRGRDNKTIHKSIRPLCFSLIILSTLNLVCMLIYNMLMENITFEIRLWLHSG